MSWLHMFSVNVITCYHLWTPLEHVLPFPLATYHQPSIQYVYSLSSPSAHLRVPKLIPARLTVIPTVHINRSIVLDTLGNGSHVDPTLPRGLRLGGVLRPVVFIRRPESPPFHRLRLTTRVCTSLSPPSRTPPPRVFSLRGLLVRGLGGGPRLLLLRPCRRASRLGPLGRPRSLGRRSQSRRPCRRSVGQRMFGVLTQVRGPTGRSNGCSTGPGGVAAFVALVPRGDGEARRHRRRVAFVS